MASRTKIVSLAPDELTELVTAVVEGLQAQLVGKLPQVMEQLLGEQEQRLLAAMALQCRPRSKQRDVPSWPNQEPAPRDPGRKPDLGKSTILGRRLDSRSFDSDPVRRAPQRSMKSIGEARDDELLGQARSPMTERRGTDKAPSRCERYFVHESLDKDLVLSSKQGPAEDSGHDHAAAKASSSSQALSANSCPHLQPLSDESWIEMLESMIGSSDTAKLPIQSQQSEEPVKAAKEVSVETERVPALPPPPPVQPAVPGRSSSVELPGTAALFDQLDSLPHSFAIKTVPKTRTTDSLGSEVSDLRRPQTPRSKSSRLSLYTSDARAVRLKREDELLGNADLSIPASEEGSSRAATPRGPDVDEGSLHDFDAVQRLSSPLPLCICGILPWGWLSVAHRRGMLLLALVLVGICATQLHHAQVHAMSPMDCTWGSCIHFGYVNDLLLAICSLLGLLAMQKVGSLKLLGSPTDLLAQYAMEYRAVQKWSSTTLWQSLHLAILWMSSLAFRAVSVSLDPSLQEVIQACAFVLSSAIFLVLVFGIQHVSCCVGVLIDSYALSVGEAMDPVRAIRQWDRLGALLRKVSRAVEWGFLLVQTTAVAVLLLSTASLLLRGNRQIWRLVSDALLAQSLVLLLSKAAEATEMCTRMPALINSLDFGGDDFSQERHYLVEHITYSAAGFYVGEVRLTTVMALKLTYVSILAAFGVLTKITAT